MKTPSRILSSILIIIAIVVLAVIGQRLAPPAQTSGSRTHCTIEAPEALRASAQQWCAQGLFGRVSVTGDDRNVIAVAQFSATGVQTWQIQSVALLATFRGLTEQMAAAAEGRDVSVAVHDPADRRLGACARKSGEPAPTCSTQ